MFVILIDYLLLLLYLDFCLFTYVFSFTVDLFCCFDFVYVYYFGLIGEWLLFVVLGLGFGMSCCLGFVVWCIFVGFGGLLGCFGLVVFDWCCLSSGFVFGLLFCFACVVQVCVED